MRKLLMVLAASAAVLLAPAIVATQFFMARGQEAPPRKCMPTLHFVSQIDANTTLDVIHGDMVEWFVEALKAQGFPVTNPAPSALMIVTRAYQPRGLVVLLHGDEVCDPVVVPIEVVMKLKKEVGA